jgi:X-X-X-Leu-X-X-Gly heptad repeat protein
MHATTFLPGTMLTTAVLELAAGQMVAGSSRLVSGVVQLALLAFGIIAGIDAVGVSSSVMFADPSDLLGIGCHGSA